MDATTKRLEALRIEGERDGVRISDASRLDLIEFVSAHRCSRRPYLSLHDNGNLRTLWSTSDGEQVGLQFRGEDQVQFVLSAKRATGKMARSAGRDTLAGLPKQLEAHGLWALTRA